MAANVWHWLFFILVVAGVVALIIWLSTMWIWPHHGESSLEQGLTNIFQGIAAPFGFDQQQQQQQGMTPLAAETTAVQPAEASSSAMVGAEIHTTSANSALGAANGQLTQMMNPSLYLPNTAVQQQQRSIDPNAPTIDEVNVFAPSNVLQATLASRPFGEPLQRKRRTASSDLRPTPLIASGDRHKIVWGLSTQTVQDSLAQSQAHARVFNLPDKL